MSDSQPRGQRGRFGPADNPSDYDRYAMGDRDPAARAAKAQYERDRRAAASAGRDTTEDGPVIRVGTQFRGQEATALQGRLTELDVTQSEYVRDLILADLGIEDTRRRPAPRRQQADGKTEGQQR